MTKTVLVTGGAGYVGSHSCKAFAEAGWNIVVYDNLSRGWRDFVRWGELIEGDLHDTAKLTEVLRDAKPDAVAHFAAFAYVAESMKQPEIYYQNNVAGTLSLLEAMRAADVRRLVFSSSCATYGVHEELITEETPQAPINPYGASKMIAERMIRDFGMAHGLKSVILRYFNAGGADPAGEIGERHDPEPHVIPLAIMGAMDGTFTFTINGTDFDTRDGTPVRDYVHVSDLADAHWRALDYLDAGGESDVFNLGTGRGVSVSELADAVSRVAGKSVPRQSGARRPGDPPSLVASAAKAERVLGWRPQRSDIDTILETAWAWHQKDNHKSRPDN
ncbi:UDP-glucose 4-epimerase GalE [Henriciella barbarensis]|uniref:UDP-glucose 4-epimerase n=1 Tax=Henriciella barbarensis TaxID=86342 RepID=A0A399QXD7_9PROT|nr:UDP-glucose 4-epimerase GalE [Henriciella barbarensis]RIJ23786.1 UDP-glucose 4-epimerase GalE [Henriciella barbarensis]